MNAVEASAAVKVTSSGGISRKNGDDIMNKQDISHEEHPGKMLALFLTAGLVGGCSHVHSNLGNQPDSFERKVFALKQITPEQARVFLAQLGITEVSVLPRHNAIIVGASQATARVKCC